MKKSKCLIIALIVPGFAVGPVLAESTSPDASAIEAAKEELQININVVWTCIAAFLVFFMQAGFAMVEVGFTQAKNAVNILMKNLMDFSIGTIAFFLSRIRIDVWRKQRVLRYD